MYFSRSTTKDVGVHVLQAMVSIHHCFFAKENLSLDIGTQTDK